MSEADVNSLLPGYHIDQLREVWGKPDTSENSTASNVYTKAKTLVLVGSKERPIMKKSATKIVHLIPNSELEVLQGYYHGDISINHADDYVERVKRLVR